LDVIHRQWRTEFLELETDIFAEFGGVGNGTHLSELV